MAPCKKAEWLHNLTFVCGLLYAKAWIKYLLKLVSFISENAHGRISSKPGSFFNSSGSSSDSEANQRAAQCGPYQAPSWPCTFHISPSLLGRHPSWFLLSAKKKEPANEREGWRGGWKEGIHLIRQLRIRGEDLRERGPDVLEGGTSSLSNYHRAVLPG